MRYRFYRVHKFVSYILTELERLAGRADFTDHEQVKKVTEQLQSLEGMMLGHAEHEDKKIHELLRNKNSTIQTSIETEHQHHISQFKKLLKILEKIDASTSREEKILLGYDFYILYRQFVAENLQHLHYEETVIMPELQKLYSDEELKKSASHVYTLMTPEQMAEMMAVIAPHVNADDRESFIRDMKDEVPEKFIKAWYLIAPILDDAERAALIEKLKIGENDPIELVPYDSDWPQLAKMEIEQLKKILPKEHIIDIQHVGSTAIPNIYSKPIIDIQIAVDALEKIKPIAISSLEKVGYIFWDFNPDPTRLVFIKGMPPHGKKRTHHVHIVEANSKHWREKILFRDYLQAHPQAAKEYESLKLRLEKQFKHDREQYTQAKADFINHILLLAKA